MAENDPQERHNQIVDVLKKLHAETALTQKPSVAELKNAVGYQITAEERDKAFAEAVPAVKEVVVEKPSDDWPQVTNKHKSTMIIGATKLLPGETGGVQDWEERKKNHAMKEFIKAGLISEA